MSAWTCRQVTTRPTQRLFRLVLESHTGRAFCAESEEKHEPVSDIDTVLVDSLKALDPNRPIREADIGLDQYLRRISRSPPSRKVLVCRLDRAWSIRGRVKQLEFSTLGATLSCTGGAIA